MHRFFNEKEFPRNANKFPLSWKDSVLALRGEVATHPVILSAAHLFSLEFNILDWQGVSSHLYYSS
jgi:hypothetical protein